MLGNCRRATKRVEVNQMPFEAQARGDKNLTEEQLSMPHNSPDGRLLGREILLAMYIHVAHHRGQAEIYLRDKGIKPPGNRI